MSTLIKQITDGSALVTFGSGERPKYAALERAIQGYYRDILRPLAELRERVFMALPFSDPAKAEEDFRYLARQRRVVDEAVSLFLAEMAGPDRSRKGFVSGGLESDTPDGVLQQRSWSTMLTGVARAGEVVGQSTTVALNRQSPAVQAMLDSAFTRLSEKGRLRLEGVRDEIHSVLVSATDAGLSPLETARQLSKQFDQYKRFEFERLARTEAAFAAEAGSREQYREYGVTHVRWVISAGACPLCVGFEGRLVELEDVENQPPIHPNCLCSTVPISEEEAREITEQGPRPPTGEEVADQLIAREEELTREIRELEAQELAGGDQFFELNRERRFAREAGDDAAYERLSRQIDEMNLRLNDLYRRRNDLIEQKSERLRELVKVEDPINLAPRWSAKRFKQGRDTIREGIEGFEVLVSQKNTNISFVEVLPTPPNDPLAGRSYYNNNAGIVMGPAARPNVVVHELGHWLEDRNPKLHEAALRFLDRRTQGEPLVRLTDLRPGANYDPAEVTRPDQFRDPYIGKEYQHPTTGARYASEVVSMGLQYMYEDPVEFARRDRDHFAFIYDLVRGRYR